MEQIQVNIKTGRQYKVLNPMVIDATNNNHGRIMVLYQGESGEVYVREKFEFLQKFMPLSKVGKIN